MTSLSALLSLASLALFLSWRGTGGVWRAAAAVGALAAAAAFKENALLIPLIALLYLWLTLPAGQRRRWAGLTLAAAAMASQVGLFLVFSHQYAIRNFTPWERLLTQGRAVARYLSLIAAPLPSRLNLDYDFPLSTSLLSPWTTLPALALHVALLAAGVALARRRPLASFGILSFYLLHLMESTVAPLELVFEHRAYLPSLFLIAAAADLSWWAVETVWRGRTRAAAATAIAAVSLAACLSGVMTWQRNTVWGDATALAEDIVRKAPGNARAHNNLGERYLAQGLPSRAEASFLAASRLDPSMTEAIGNLGVVLLSSGKPREALARFTEAQSRGTTPRPPGTTSAWPDSGWARNGAPSRPT